MNFFAVAPSEVLQIGVAVIVAVAIGCIAILRGTIDTCRRSGRETRTGNLRQLLYRSTAPPYSHDNLTQCLNDFIDSYFCSNKLLFLRFALSTSLIITVASVGFLVFAYYLQHSVLIPMRVGFEKVESLNRDRGIHVNKALADLTSGTMLTMSDAAIRIPSILATDQADEKSISQSIPRAERTISNAASVSSIIVIVLLVTNLLITMLVAWLNEYLPELRGVIFV